MSKAKTIVIFYDEEGQENGALTIKDKYLHVDGVDFTRLDLHQEHIYRICSPHLTHKTIEYSKRDKEVCEDNKHEYGSEEYRSDGKAYYKCNKCDKEVL